VKQSNATSTAKSRELRMVWFSSITEHVIAGGELYIKSSYTFDS